MVRSPVIPLMRFITVLYSPIPIVPVLCNTGSAGEEKVINHTRRSTPGPPDVKKISGKRKLSSNDSEAVGIKESPQVMGQLAIKR